MAADMWQVYFTSIRMVCIKDYTQEQISAWAPESFDLSLFKEKMKKLNPFVALSDKKVIGYADLQPDGHIDHFFVHGEHQGAGAGKALMSAIINNGVGLSRLYSYVSHTAKPFYLKNGFIVIKVRNEEIRGVKIENNLMVREN